MMSKNPDLPKLLRAIANGTQAKEHGHDNIFNTAADELEDMRGIVTYHRSIAILTKQIRDELLGILHDTVSTKDLQTDFESECFIRRQIVRWAINETAECEGAIAVENLFVNAYYQIVASKLSVDDFDKKYNCVERASEKKKGRTHD